MPRPTAALLLGLLLTGDLAALDWPQWRGPTRDGRWPEKGLPDRLPDKLTPRWKRPIGGGYGGVAVAAGRVYLMDRQKGPPEVERVVCLDAKSGEALWVHAYPVRYGRLDYGNGPRCTPAVAGGKVYTLGALGRLCCLDARSGKEVWSRDAVKDFGGTVPTWGHACSPLVDGGRVVVQVGGRAACLVALDAGTGREVWRGLDDRPGYASVVSLKLGKGRQLVYFTPQHVAGLEPATGRRLWRVPFEGITYDVAIADVVDAGGVLLASNYWSGSKAIRLDADGGNPKVVWQGDEVRLLMSTPLVSGRYAYALDRTRGLLCLDVHTGKVLWDRQHVTPRGSNPHASLVWVGGGRALVLNANGELLLVGLTPAGLTRHGKAAVVGKTWAHPAFADRCVFARNDEEVVCVPLAGR